ncbi:MAG: metallophosphoesterase family protein [Clostridia bacterium]|nr:metallophosphoesterase family protein [Clostridia bacterium]
MKILVFSDSHARYKEMREVVARHAATTDAVFFLGDGYRDFCRVRDEFSTIAFYGVLGNCDLGAPGDPAVYERVVSLDGFRFLLMHGHRFHVKTGMETAIAYAKEKEANVLLYGHTHAPADYREGELFVFNPGSIGEYTDGRRTYGILQTVNGVLVRSHADLTGAKM